MSARRFAGGLALAILAAAAPVRAQNWPSEAPPRPLAARPVSFPPYEMRTLENGLRVVAVLHHEQPVVSVRMIVRAGAALDPRGKAGLANLAASLLDQGTTTKSAQQVNEEIDFIGGVMGAGAGTDLTFANVVVMKDSFETGLRMLSDMARNPGFASEEIERQRQQTLSALQVNLEDPEFVADAVFDRLVYGFHPYGLPQSGTPETIASITRQDLTAYHQRYFVPNNAILAVVGDVTAEEAFSGVQKVFGDWQRRDLPSVQPVAPPEPTRRVVVINKPDAVQTEVRAGHLGVKRTNEDYMALNLALRILGGEGANRLHQVLRTERGLTYGAKAEMDTLLDSGDFEASTNTRSEATGEALRLMVDEFWRLQRERVGERELNDAKAYMTGSFPLTIETPDAIATQVLNVLFYGLPVEQLQSFRDRVNAVRPEDIERVARYYLRPDRLSIVLVGNAARFLPQLRSLGFSNVETVEASELDLMAVNFKRASRVGRAGGAGGVGEAGKGGGAGAAGSAGGIEQLAYAPQSAQATRRPQTTAAEQQQARQMLARVIEAKGGLERLRAVKVLVAKATATTSDPNVQAGLTIETTTSLEYPNRMHVETKGPQGDLVQAFDGSRGWVRDPSGVHDIPPEAIPELQATFSRDTLALLLAADAGNVHLRLLPPSKDEAGRAREALEFSSQTLDPIVLYIDPATWLISRQTYVAGGMGRAVVEEIFDDYRQIEGISIAFSARIRVRGQQVLERRLTSITINPPISPSLFARPAS